ncbi:DUF2946 family protein [Pseudomonas sp. ABC1]|uniref:DUF2946 family protein n=1 Tax=Pseudomonas sp. ABC1 TaxID=2748080 RepID=UPI0015C353DB|nr:DUF2946 family protein [Pseudomonas sp. ABC1]QLF93423.1 DUF2946 family protein [Pseudomonas sp. ABC1]
MNPARRHRSLTAWMLYFSVLFAALGCALGHGQMAGLQLSGMDGRYCSFEGNFGAGANLDGSGIVPPSPATGGGCAMSSSFSAIILAAFFGLLGLLATGRAQPLALRIAPRPARHAWPPAQPRAPPATLPVL